MLKYIISIIWMIIVWILSVIVTIIEFIVKYLFKLIFNWQYRVELDIGSGMRAWVRDNHRFATKWFY